MDIKHTIKVFVHTNADMQKVQNIMEECSKDKSYHLLDTWESSDEGQEGGGVFIDYEFYEDSYYDELFAALKESTFDRFIEISLYRREVSLDDADFTETCIKSIDPVNDTV